MRDDLGPDSNWKCLAQLDTVFHLLIGNWISLTITRGALS